MPHSNQSVDSRGAYEKNVAISFLVVTWVFVLLRVYVRGYMIRSFGWDDSTMIFANLCFTMYCVSLLYIEAHGGGTHMTDYNAMNKVINWTVAAEDLYVVTVCFLKISLGIFFNRIVVQRWQRILILTVVIISTLQSIVNFFFLIFRCGTPIGNYLIRQLENQCASHTTNLVLLYLHAAVSTTTDWIFALLPVVILWNAKMDIRTKLSVGFILSLGAVGSICSIVRFFYIDGLTQTDDFFWNATNTAIWSTIEPGTGIIAGSMATMRPLFKLLFTEVRDFTSSFPSITNVSKRMSRSFRSNPTSAADKSATDTRNFAFLKPGRYSHTDSEHTRTTATAVGEDHKSIELKSGSGFSAMRTGISSEYIVTRNDDRDGTWPHRGMLVTHNSGASDDGIEIDRRSSHTLGDEERRDVRMSMQPPSVQGHADDMV